MDFPPLRASKNDLRSLSSSKVCGWGDKKKDSVHAGIECLNNSISLHCMDIYIHNYTFCQTLMKYEYLSQNHFCGSENLLMRRITSVITIEISILR